MSAYYYPMPYNIGTQYYNGYYRIVGEGALTPIAPSQVSTLIADMLPTFKQHARITYSFDDALCELYLSSAISRIEQYCFLPIAFKTYEWSIPEWYANAEQVQLPLRNCALVGASISFEPAIAQTWIPTPTTWPVELNVGYVAGTDVPPDLMLTIFELALGLYNLRSTPEMFDVYSEQVLAGSLGRYYVPRC